MTGEPLDDPNYVQWKAYIIESDGLSQNEVKKELEIRICNENDWSTFYEPSPSDKNHIEFLKEQN